MVETCGIFITEAANVTFVATDAVARAWYGTKQMYLVNILLQQCSYEMFMPL